ncbi:hypothetical protein [uncultured Bacteroides sp.]|uniref:hypothetical protein n=1 Tax=uncultured Bacteroides sp. TaxID=162156 RepID=UPI002AA7D8C4|nr:hypothetical protein [uncultured Bacteroides sp.]
MTMNEKRTPDVGFVLKQIVTKQFATIEDAFVEGCPVSMNVELRFSVNSENRIINASAIFKFINNGLPFLLLEVECFFEIKETSWKQFIDEQGNICVPKDFIRYLAMHTVGTARGVLHAKTENTQYNRYIIPPINVAEMVQDDLKVNIQ